VVLFVAFAFFLGFSLGMSFDQYPIIGLLAVFALGVALGKFISD
jgi:hypothetical protein